MYHDTAAVMVAWLHSELLGLWAACELIFACIVSCTSLGTMVHTMDGGIRSCIS